VIAVERDTVTLKARAEGGCGFFFFLEEEEELGPFVSGLASIKNKTLVFFFLLGQNPKKTLFSRPYFVRRQVSGES
jgi:hypothetical protein